jgi:hypothetical protein
MLTRRIVYIVVGLAAFGLFDGLLLGLFVGWFVQPVPEAASSPLDQDEYVWLVSVAYSADDDLTAAQLRLSRIQPDKDLVAMLVSEAARRASLQKAGQARPLIQLASALGANKAEEVTEELPAATTLDVNPAAIDPDADTVITPTIALTSTRTYLFIPMAAAAAMAAPTTTQAVKGNSALQSTLTRMPATSAPSSRVSVPGPPPKFDFKIALVRQLTACENGGNHHIFVLVLDQGLNGIPGMQVEFVWPSGRSVDITGKKVENIPTLGIDSKTTPGYLNFPLYHGSYRVRVLNGTSEQSNWLSVDIPQNELCVRKDNPIGNSLYHYSYLIVFQKVQ